LSIVDQASATMRLKAMFDNEDERLWPGDFVNARVLVELRHDVLTVPPAAVQRGPDGIYAWVVMPGDVVQARPIQSGPTTGDDTIITSGLSEGERVVINGQYKLQQNSKVIVNEATAPATPATAKRDRAS
jgi:multidrug efflux system membrane fusion protein